MHIVHAIEHKEWPVSINFSAGDESDIPSNEKECSEVITITTDHGISRNTTPGNNMSQSKKRKRHIAIDVETERGKIEYKLHDSQIISDRKKYIIHVSRF